MARITRIEDPADPRIEVYRDVKDRDLRGREGFMAEGAVVLGNAATRSTHPFRSLLVAESRLASLESVIAALPAECTVYVAKPAVLDAIAGFHIHRGILAHGERTAGRDVGALLEALGPGALVVAAFGIANHDNLGGIFRNAVAFGADAVLLDPACCDPLYRKAIRVSVGASLICPFARADTSEQLVDALSASSLTAFALAGGGELEIGDLPESGDGIALLVGSEGHGLPETAMQRFALVRIAMTGNLDSLNAATATGIALHAAARRLKRI
ncbi:TrmH family RNA methyltransferase [Tepidamorphus sp. 3E244]|uniref:TrmH family RNA methyltransferase n=1 Tax=Tepidamorphus sp. 3E244 TaxID=3385498 RepID=UPI0038FCF6E0